MGLLGKVGKKFKDGSLFDGFGAAQAALAGDYGSMASINARGRERKEEEKRRREKEAAVQDAQRRAYAYAKSIGMSEEAAMAAANDPDTVSGMIRDRSKPVEFATTGGSRLDPVTNGWIRAPGRDADGNEYGLSTDPNAAQPLLRPGTKSIVIPDGGTIGAVDALSGRELTAADVAQRSGLPPGPPASAPRIGQAPAQPAEPGNVFRPGQVVQGYRFKGGDDADPNSWEKVEGGAGPRGPSRFPY